ncbi:hypothetical protein [Roseomonas sp. BN140053]|uniref:hypothetical protein n=1 Tax=Roseomonas sp. BN140053 TaxID=3391898 RepID=UPI0039E81518
MMAETAVQAPMRWRIGPRGALFAVFLAISLGAGLVDGATGGRDTGTGLDLATRLVGMALFVLTIALWCEADARQAGRPSPGKWTRFLVVVALPFGLALYLLRSRPLGWAVGWFLLFVAGSLVAEAFGMALGVTLLVPRT